MNRRGMLLILSSPSGAGKTTIAKALIAKDRDLVSSVSVTTRKARENERDTIDYYFVDESKFVSMIESNEFVEYANVFGYRYGTLRKHIEGHLIQGIDVVLDIDWQGNKQLLESELKKDLVSVFILPPTMEELRSRLFGRDMDNRETMEHRMREAISEIRNWNIYDYVIVNHTIDDSVKKVMKILHSERMKRIRQTGLPDFIEMLLDKKC